MVAVKHHPSLHLPTLGPPATLLSSPLPPLLLSQTPLSLPSLLSPEHPLFPDFSALLAVPSPAIAIALLFAP